jgi:TetR/AcrR family transcriptional repressor of nem operon
MQSMQEFVYRMKKSVAETIETRKRIIDVASQEFREKGIDATRIDDLMAAAGLTRGGFYGHFESKDQVVAEACTKAMEGMGDFLRGIGEPGKGLGKIAAAYLSPEHRDNRANGCPVAALAGELSHLTDGVRDAATDGLNSIIEVLAEQYDVRSDVARRRAIVALSTMVGALTVARFVSDPALSDEILDLARKSVSTSG